LTLFLSGSWEDFVVKMCDIIAYISVEEQSDIEEDLEVIRKYNDSDTRSIEMLEEKANTIRDAATSEAFWEYCKSATQVDYKFEHVLDILGEEDREKIFNATDFESFKRMLYDCAYMYSKLAIEAKEQRKKELREKLEDDGRHCRIDSNA